MSMRIAAIPQPSLAQFSASKYIQRHMHITKFTDLAFRTLIYLRSHRQNSTVAEMAKDMGSSKNHLSKVVHRLAKLGYIDSKKGKHGGIRLSSNVTELSLGKLFQELEPEAKMSHYFGHQPGECKGGDCCQLQNAFAEARQAFIVELTSHFLAWEANPK